MLITCRIFYPALGLAIRVFFPPFVPSVPSEVLGVLLTAGAGPS